MANSVKPKTFVLLVDGDASDEERDAITEYIHGLHEAQQVGWWHQLTHAWVIYALEVPEPALFGVAALAPPAAPAIQGQEETPSPLSVVQLRDELNRLAPSANCLVLEVEPLNWASKNSDVAHTWLHTWLNMYQQSSG